jgi:dolichol-phosphate mannosyltransferase
MIHASIIIPTFREAGNLEQLVERISRSLAHFDGAFEILIVDDDSQDGTEQVANSLRDSRHPLRLIVRREERGLSSAVIRGLDEAKGALLVCMDADLSHPPEMIPVLLDALSKPEVEFVIGSRYVTGAGTDADWGIFRRLNSLLATWLARPFTGARDPLSGFFALRRERYKNRDRLSPLGYKIGLELIVKCNCRNVEEVPIHFAQRRCGSSKLTLKQQWLYLRHIGRLACYKLTKRR